MDVVEPTQDTEHSPPLPFQIPDYSPAVPTLQYLYKWRVCRTTTPLGHIGHTVNV